MVQLQIERNGALYVSVKFTRVTNFKNEQDWMVDELVKLSWLKRPARFYSKLHFAPLNLTLVVKNTRVWIPLLLTPGNSTMHAVLL